MFSKLMALKIDEIGREKSLAFMVLFSFVVMMLGSSRSIYGVYMPDDFLLASQKMPMSFYLNQGRFIQAAITGFFGNDSNLLIVFYVQIMPDDFVMQLHRF